MRRFVFVSVICLFCSSCSYFLDPMLYVRTPTIAFSSLDDLRIYVVHNIKYKSDPPEYWQAPQETIDKGTGDCEDFAILVAYFAREMGYDVMLVGITTTNGNHMIVSINGVCYEAQSVTPYKGTINVIARFTLDDALRICYNRYGSRSVYESL